MDTTKDFRVYLCDEAKKNSFCWNPDCPNAVFQVEGRWFISMGHPGFTTTTNDRYGYSSQEEALEAVCRYGTNGYELKSPPRKVDYEEFCHRFSKNRRSLTILNKMGGFTLVFGGTVKSIIEKNGYEDVRYFTGMPKPRLLRRYFQEDKELFFTEIE